MQCCAPGKFWVRRSEIATLDLDPIFMFKGGQILIVQQLLTPFSNPLYLKEGFSRFQCLFMWCTLYRTGVVVPVPGWPVPLLHKELEGQRCGANMERFVLLLFFFHKNNLHSLQVVKDFAILHIVNL
jgi:hypothetical protein